MYHTRDHRFIIKKIIVKIPDYLHVASLKDITGHGKDSRILRIRWVGVDAAWKGGKL